MTKHLGRKPRKFDKNIPHYGTLKFANAARFMRALAPIPASVDYTSRLNGNLGAMLNDEKSDCTCATFYHLRQVWTSQTSTEITEPDSNVLELYEQACGYDPNDPSTDNGGVEQDVLKFLLNTGAPVGVGLRDKIRAFIEVDPANMDYIRRTILDCGGCYIGVNLSQSAMSSQVWDVGGDETIVGGHAVCLVGYDAVANTFKLISWGQIYECTVAFMQKFCEEAYGIVDESWLASTGKTPLGMTEEELDDAMDALKEGFF